MTHLTLVFVFAVCFCCCKPSTGQQPVLSANKERVAATFDTAYRTIHVMVALCDNKYQGIVPVPAAIGNGQDPGF